jgi:hypothetical protein
VKKYTIIIIVILIIFITYAAHSAKIEESAVTDDTPVSINLVWKVGDWWILRDTRLSMYSEEGVENLPPIEWKYSVASIEQIDSEECFKIEVYQVDGTIFPHAELYYSTSNLRIKKVNYYYMRRDEIIKKESIFDENNPVSLSKQFGGISYFLPIMPISLPQGSKSVSETYSIELDTQNRMLSLSQEIESFTITALNGIPKNIVQINSPGAKVTFNEEGLPSLVQYWFNGLPWALLSENNWQRVVIISHSSE